MRKMMSSASLLVAFAAFAAQAAAADRASVNFMHKAARAGLAEVELGRLALDRSNDNEIRGFAQRMIDDHSRANSELRDLAAHERVTLPNGVTKAQLAAFNRLRRLRGNAFDRAFMDQMNVDHDQAVNLFRTQARYGRDTDVRQWADRTLPTLQHHRQMARDLRRDELREARR
jgi:putative membrane protein